MSFLTKKRKVKPAWVYRAKGMVWRVVSAGESMFVGEDRDPEKKHVSFFGLNRLSGEVLWENVSDERWWISIEAVHGDRVFLHGYSRPDMPDHQRVLALDLFTGRLIWSRDDMRYVVAAGDSVFTSKDTASGRIIFELQLGSGTTVRFWDNDAAELNAARYRTQALQGEPEFPVPMGEIVPADPRLDPIRKLSRNKNVVGPVEVLLKDNLCLFSYHERSDPTGLLTNVLNVVDVQSGECLFAETLGRNVQSAVPDSYFVQGRYVYFVRDRSLLTAVDISGLIPLPA